MKTDTITCIVFDPKANKNRHDALVTMNQITAKALFFGSDADSFTLVTTTGRQFKFPKNPDGQQYGEFSNGTTTQELLVIKKNSFNSNLVIVTPTKIPHLFPTVGTGISGNNNLTRRHFSGTNQTRDDLAARVLSTRELQILQDDGSWQTRAILPIGSYVRGFGKLFKNLI